MDMSIWDKLTVTYPVSDLTMKLLTNFDAISLEIYSTEQGEN